MHKFKVGEKIKLKGIHWKDTYVLVTGKTEDHIIGIYFQKEEPDPHGEELWNKEHDWVRVIKNYPTKKVTW